jgi:hypothetical protein
MNSAYRPRTQWRTLVEEQQASGLSVPAFCRRVGVAESSFYRWCQKLRTPQRFAEVRLAAAEAARDAGGIELHLPGQRYIVVRPGFDRQTLRDLLATLEGLA